MVGWGSNHRGAEEQLLSDSEHDPEGEDDSQEQVPREQVLQCFGGDLVHWSVLTIFQILTNFQRGHRQLLDA